MGIDAVGVLTVFVITLVAIPSGLIVGPLGSAGTPADILAACMLVGWLTIRVSRSSHVESVRQPIRVFMWLFAIAVALSYIAANLRSTMADEARAANVGLLLVAAWLGILSTTMDLIPSRERLDVLLRRIVLAVGLLAAFGIVQFATKEPFTNYIQIPGLTANNSLVHLYARGGLARPSGTAVHPIEFGAVLTMVLPLALHYALTDEHRSILRRWFPVVAIAFAVPISISRSAVISAVVVLCILVPTWPTIIRRRAYAAIVILSGAVYMLVPGLLGTITGLFTGLAGGSNTQSRTGSFPLAFEFVARAPFFGRGFRTFLPSYRILDDQYLGLLIEIGILGLLAFLGLLASGVWVGFQIWRRSSGPTDSTLGIALTASIASALASFATFDALSFPMATGMIFVVLGSVGALSRLGTSNSGTLRNDEDCDTGIMHCDRKASEINSA